MRVKTMLAKVEGGRGEVLVDAWPLVLALLCLGTVRRMRVHQPRDLPVSAKRVVEVHGVGQGPWHTIDVRGPHGFQRIEVKARRVKGVWDEISGLLKRRDYFTIREA